MVQSYPVLNEGLAAGSRQAEARRVVKQLAAAGQGEGVIRMHVSNTILVRMLLISSYSRESYFGVSVANRKSFCST
jgi:hypothetical protein